MGAPKPTDRLQDVLVVPSQASSETALNAICNAEPAPSTYLSAATANIRALLNFWNIVVVVSLMVAEAVLLLSGQFPDFVGPSSLIQQQDLAPATGEPALVADQPALLADLLGAMRASPTDSSGCHSFGLEKLDDRWFEWELGLGYKHFEKASALKCVDALPSKHVVFIGDSILRNVFRQLLMFLHAPQSHLDVLDLQKNPHHSKQNHLHTEGDAKLQFIFTRGAKTIIEQLHNFPEAMSADVMFLDSGSWELANNQGSNALFMMSYITHFSAAIKFLQENFKGRVIFLMTPPSSHDILGKGWARYSIQWNSKIQALNRFAEKLVIGAGFEVLNIYDFMFTGQGGFISYKALTMDGFHPNVENNWLALRVYLNEICRGPAFKRDTPSRIVEATTGFDGSTCLFSTGKPL